MMSSFNRGSDACPSSARTQHVRNAQPGLSNGEQSEREREREGRKEKGERRRGTRTDRVDEEIVHGGRQERLGEFHEEVVHHARHHVRIRLLGEIDRLTCVRAPPAVHV
jgi:hypothetical protein